MSEDAGLLNNLIKGFNDLKLAAVDKLSEMSFFSFETPFLDEAFIAQGIKMLEKHYEMVRKELKQHHEFSNGDEYYLKKQRETLHRKNTLAVQLAFYLALDPKQLPRATRVLEDVDDSFKICLNALRQYANNDFDAMLDTSFGYVKAIGAIPEHYLFNRNLSEILFQKSEHKKAIPFLRKAIEKKPEEIGLHKMLLFCYQHEGLEMEAGIEKQILDLLQGGL